MPKKNNRTEGEEDRFGGFKDVDAEQDESKIDAMTRLVFAPEKVVKAIEDASKQAFKDPNADLEAALDEFFSDVADLLGKRKRFLSVEYLLFATTPKAKRARKDLERVHDDWFARFVTAANAGELSRRPLVLPKPNKPAPVYEGARDMALDGMRAYLLACRSEPQGAAATRARRWYAAMLADLVSSRMARAFPDELDALESALAEGIQHARVPFTPFRLSSALRFAHRVVFAGLS
jgi:hypothetical protein